ncbi:hypothetical protein BC938DRAFT_475954 [Jimgerdemannia flammicorona]|uniref:Uncharacterized protein n=1 Tax=Jimgerdemannia flammicorona TaxID=994334 RepID=A0A433PLR9_9FUNG|nr:hypothetical protein BC938DRAFT_475954 [Jimgerdemannia flammicorona]
MEISIQSKHESFEQEQIDAARIYRELLKDSAYYLLPPPPPKVPKRYRHAGDVAKTNQNKSRLLPGRIAWCD